MRRLAWLSLVCAACSVDAGLLGGLERGGAGSSGGAAGGPAQNRCDPGPIVTLPDRSGALSYSACAGHVAAAHFLNALCSCADARLGNFLQTRGFDSRRGAYQSGQPDDSGASVGVNGEYVLSAGFTDVGGSLSLAGSAGPTLTGSLQVRGDLRCAGDLTVTGAANIARNAWLTGNLVALGAFNIGGTFHHQGSARGLLLTSGSESIEAVSVPAPCACAPAELLDIAALVSAAARDNDNASAGLSADHLASLEGAATLSLPCGRWYLSRIAGAGAVTLSLSGRTALFVEEGIDLDGTLTIAGSTGAELDLFVAGDLHVSGAIALADRARPAAGRLYVAGAREISLVSPWVGNLYAPNARVSAALPLEVWGSLFTAQFQSSASTSFVFDRAVLSAGDTCTTPSPPAGSCSRCGWCSGGTACVAGVCTACRTDDDCCSQSVCSNGSCTALVEVR